MAILTAADFGNPIVNGTYTSSGSKDGQTRYVKDSNSNIIIEYRSEYGPYCFSGAYYMLSINQIEGSVPITKPLYKVDSSDPTDTSWVSMLPQTAGSTYNTAGTVS